MGRNLKYQFKFAIEKNFKEGMDKHSIKKSNKMNSTRIFSYSDRKNLIDLSSNFSNWMKTNHPEIKLAKDVESTHIQDFLNEKSETCSCKTLEQYCSKFKKLENIINATYSTDANYRGFVTPITLNNNKIRNSAFDRDDLISLKKELEKSRSSAAINAVELASRVGLRAEECSKIQGRDIDLQNGVIKIVDSKGKRSRNVEIDRDDRQYFEKLKSKYDDFERICPIQKNSVNKAVRRAMKSIGISEKYEKSTIHALRKYFAQNRFDKYRGNGESIEKAIDLVSNDLGHGNDRYDLMKEYILKIR